jgi:hypothetical protein
MFLELAYYSAIAIHVIFGAIPVFVDLVDNHC